MYGVTRQHYWADGQYVVEVAYGGLEYANPDALVPKYEGEMKEYRDPRKAVEVAIAICKAWRKDGCRKAKVAVGSTSGYTMPFEGGTFSQARKWAEEEYKALPKCPVCGKITTEHGAPCSWLCEWELAYA